MRTIEVRPGRLHMIADGCEEALAEAGWKFSVLGNTVYGSYDSRVIAKPINPVYLRDLLSQHADFVKMDGRMRGLKPCDPPRDVVTMVMNRIRTKGSEEAVRLYERARDKVRLVHSSGGQ